ncbi:MAG: Ig-like domain-containing protein [Burkholderiaceae bacterium]|nr:Ig-like domain-containing protein [Burkholderiaceae bacterium]
MSNDGKVRLVVPAGAVSGSSRITIEKVDPDAATAADPLYLAGSSYRISGDVGNLTLPATWELTLDAPLSVSRASDGRLDLQSVRAASVPALDTGKSCNGSDGKQMGGEWVIGDRCPTGCKYTGSFTDVNQTTYSSCQPIVFYFYDTAAPFCDFATTSNKSWVQVPPSTNPLLYAEFAASAGPGVLCALYRTPPPPVLVGNVPNALNLMPCTVSGNTLSCKKPQVKPGVFKVLADNQAPTDVRLHTLNEGFKTNEAVRVTLGLDGTGELRYGISGQDDRVAAQAELWEIELDFVPGPNGPQPTLNHILRATVADNNSSSKVFTSSGSPPATLSFNASDRFKRYFFARLYDSAGNSTDSPIIPATRITPLVDVPSFTANPATLPPPSGTTTLTWSVANALSVSIDQGVGDVTAQTVNGSGSIQVNVNSTRTFTLTATGPNNTTATRTVTVTVAPDTTPPTVTLAASPGTVLAPGATTLTANATDNVGVTQVEFYRGATLIGTDTTAGDGFTQNVAFTIADQGNVAFTSRAVDAAGNQATSAAINVLVTVPLSADRYVSPTGSDANPGTQAQPYRTLTRAFANVGTGGTVWLENGTYTWAAEATAGASQLDFKTRSFPAGRTLRAITSGQATVNFGFTVSGDATIVGIHITNVANDGPGSGGAGLFISGSANPTAQVQLKGVSFGALTGGSGGGWEAVIYNQCTNCSVTLDNNGVAGFNYIGTDFLPGARFITNLGGPVTINGGTIGSLTLSTLNNGCGGSVFTGHRASFNGVTFTLPATAAANAPAFCLLGSDPVTLTNSTVTQEGSGRAYLFLIGFGISGIPGNGNLVLNNSTVTAPGTGVLVGLRLAGVRFTASGSTLSGGQNAIGRVGGEGLTNSAITLTGTTVQNVNGTAIDMDGFFVGSTFRMTGGEMKNIQGTALRLASGNLDARLRNVVISNAGISQGEGAVVLIGDNTSVYNLGTAAEPGGNTILGNNATRPGVRVNLSGGGIANAVGNTWVASQQGASGSGTYSGSLVVTSGSGQNYAVTSGSLRLSGN